MLVQAIEINYDYNNKRVVRGRQRADLLQRHHARSRQGHLRPDDQAPARRRQRAADRAGRQDHLRPRSSTSATTSATASSTRCASTPPTRPAWRRRAPTAPSGNFTVLHSGVYTACEPCKDDPKKPPLWQVKAARMIHDQSEKMIYFEDARLEFFGMPIAYLPYFSAPDPTVKRKTGFLMPIVDQQLDVRLRHRDAVLLGAGARLRLHVLAALHDQAGRAAAGRMAPAADQRRLHDPRQRHLSARQGLLPARRRRRHSGLSRLPRQHRNHRPVRAERQVDVGLGRHRCRPIRRFSRTTALQTYQRGSQPSLSTA